MSSWLHYLEHRRYMYHKCPTLNNSLTHFHLQFALVLPSATILCTYCTFPDAQQEILLQSVLLQNSSWRHHLLHHCQHKMLCPSAALPPIRSIMTCFSYCIIIYFWKSSVSPYAGFCVRFLLSFSSFLFIGQKRVYGLLSLICMALTLI